MKNNYQTIVFKDQFIIGFLNLFDCYDVIKWHQDCKSARCIAEIHYALEYAENCGGYIP